MTKLVIIDTDARILARVVNHIGAEHRRLANKVMEEALAQGGMGFEELTYVVATGYGRMTVPFADRQISELTCYAREVYRYFPNVSLAIDIGGQDAKGLKIQKGKLIDFVMSDKCAAGTGRFLDIIAGALSYKVEDLGGISSKSTNKVIISKTCTVFARQEVVTRLSEGVLLEDIVAGIHDAIASRITSMVARLKTGEHILLTGGVAKNIGAVKALERNLGCEVLVPEEPLRK
jgi:predicted CoA-substrate-specific enzyme activase